MNSQTQILTKHTIKYANKNIDISLQQSPRKTFSIEVSPDMTVIVKAPENVSHEQIMYKIEQKKSRIYKQVCYFQELQPKLKDNKYIPWETFLYLWKEYILKIKKTKEDEHVELNENIMYVYAKDKNSAKEIIEKRYTDQSYKIFKDKLYSVLKLFKEQDISLKGLRIRKMHRRRWSCSKNWTITINIELVKAPIWCIKYVLAHECCHLLEFNHNKKFYELLEYVMPDWEKQKLRLEILLG